MLTLRKKFSLLARNAPPATPARLVGQFSCKCIDRLKPRRDGPMKGMAGRENACKAMHPVDAWLHSGKITVF